MNMVESLKKTRRTFIQNQQERKNHDTRYKVEGQIKGEKEMIFVLSGYKPYLWKDVFSRIKSNQPSNAEVCVISSGKYVKELSDLCKKNDWVYVSTELNNICVATNIVMRLFSQAEYIHKLDEDIYVPDGYFEDMKKAYDIIEQKEACEIGYVCPVLPLGFYGMHDFLIKVDALDEYEAKFGKHRIGGTMVNPVFRKRCGVDAFIWEKIGNFDDCAAMYKKDGFSYHACVSRSGIAAILFKRTFWNKIGSLKYYRGKGLGNEGDEGQITSFCALNFQLTFCVNNILVGHFAFGGAEPDVLKLKEAKPEIFEKRS